MNWALAGQVTVVVIVMFGAMIVAAMIVVEAYARREEREIARWYETHRNHLSRPSLVDDTIDDDDDGEPEYDAIAPVRTQQ